jgi:hypothetical protein
MIRITTLFFLVILGVNELIAQSKEFPTTEATWRYNIEDPTPTEAFHTIQLTNDSIINGTTYQSINNGSSGFFRTEGKKVYHLPKDSIQDILIYDFSLVEGDPFVASFYSLPIDTVYVEKVDSVLTNDGFRKRWSFKDEDGTVDGRWIEGIGSYRSLTRPFFGTSFPNEMLTCFKMEDDWIYETIVSIPTVPLTEYSCDGLIISTDNPSLVDGQIKISPNPYMHQFEILTPDVLDNTIIEIYSIYGQLVQTIAYKKQINLPELPPGIYLISFHLEQIRYISLLQKL